MDAFRVASRSEPRLPNFTAAIGALQMRLSSLPSAYDLPQGMTYEEPGTEITRRQELQRRELGEIQHALDILCLRVELAQVNLKIEQSRRVAEEAQREIQQLKREKTQ